ncbi:hypothetical protein [Leifsonia xyli]|uniref:hypothetical protein n=1 Tax=Leifsonia xyli TaxID=1575 RepID=UPI003D66E97D
MDFRGRGGGELAPEVDQPRIPNGAVQSGLRTGTRAAGESVEGEHADEQQVSAERDGVGKVLTRRGDRPEDDRRLGESESEGRPEDADQRTGARPADQGHGDDGQRDDEEVGVAIAGRAREERDHVEVSADGADEQVGDRETSRTPARQQGEQRDHRDQDQQGEPGAGIAAAQRRTRDVDHGGHQAHQARPPRGGRQGAGIRRSRQVAGQAE